MSIYERLFHKQLNVECLTGTVKILGFVFLGNIEADDVITIVMR